MLDVESNRSIESCRVLFAPQQQIGTVPAQASAVGRIHTDMVYGATPRGNEGGANSVLEWI